MDNAQSVEALCECGHVWPLTKEPQEMSDGPRCSECGATGDDISIVHKQPEDAASPEESELVRKARVDRRIHELRDRATDLLQRLEESASEGPERSLPQEMRGTYQELTSLHEQLDDADSETDHSFADLDAVDYRLTTLREEIDEHDELKSEHKELNEKNAELRAENQQLAEQLEQNQTAVEELRSEILTDTSFNSIPELAAAAREYRENKRRAEELDQRLAKKETQIKNAESVIFDCQRRGYEVREVLDRLQTIDNLETEKERLRSHIQEHQKEKQELASAVADRQDSLESLTEAIQEKKDQLECVEQQLDAAEQELEEMQEEVAKTKQKATDIEAAEALIDECKAREIPPQKALDTLRELGDTDIELEMLALAAITSD